MSFISNTQLKTVQEKLVENLRDGTLIPNKSYNLEPDVNDEVINYEDGYTNNGTTVFGTGDNETVDGEATLLSVQGRTEWSGNTPSYSNVVSNTSVKFNLFNPTAGYAHVVKSNDTNNGLCIYGTDVTTENKILFSTTTDFTSATQLTISEATNTTGDTYLKVTVSNDGYIKLADSTGTAIDAPEDFCVSNVWGGYRVKQHTPYEQAVVTINSATVASNIFSGGMKSISNNGDVVVYDELTSTKAYKRVQEYTFAATPSLTYSAATTGTTKYNIYYMALSTAPVAGGYAEIGGVTKFAISTSALSSSSNPTSDCMYLYNSSSTYRLYFAIAQSEDSTTTTTYSIAGTDDATYTITDSASFATALEHYGTLYTSSDGTATGEMTSVSEYDSGVSNYFYGTTTTDPKGLNGQAIIDAVGGKKMNYQIKSMNTTTYTGTTISPALNWTYKMGDFGTEMLTLASGFPATPVWIVSYPLNIKETVQTLPQNYVSLDSVENLLHQVGNNQGFDFDSISYDNSTGKMKINGLVTTKETIVKSTFNLNVGGTLKHLLAIQRNIPFTNINVVDLSTLSWTNNGGWGTNRFLALIEDLDNTNSATSPAFLLCPIYNTPSRAGEYTPNLTISTWNTLQSNNIPKIIVTDSRYSNNRTGFINSVKGILLAYKKR